MRRCRAGPGGESCHQRAATNPARESHRLERYLDSLEREEEERTAREGTTSAMRAVAAASDAREAFPYIVDDEHEDFLHRTAGSAMSSWPWRWMPEPSTPRKEEHTRIMETFSYQGQPIEAEKVNEISGSLCIARLAAYDIDHDGDEDVRRDVTVIALS